MSENGQRVIAEIRKVAAERPDHVFGELCVYVHHTNKGKQPGCLVGHGLWNVGLIDGKFESRDENGIVIDALQPWFDFDDDETHWLREVQIAQDKCHTWGVAVKTADAAVELRVMT